MQKFNTQNEKLKKKYKKIKKQGIFCLKNKEFVELKTVIITLKKKQNIHLS